MERDGRFGSLDTLRYGDGDTASREAKPYEIPWQISLQRAVAADTGDGGGSNKSGGSTYIDYAVSGLSMLPVPTDDLFG